MFLGSQINKEIVRFINNLFNASVGAVNFIDNQNNRQMQSKCFF